MRLLSLFTRTPATTEGTPMPATLTGTIVFDKDGYGEGDTITATITHAGTDVQVASGTLTVTLTDPAGETEVLTSVMPSVTRSVNVPTTVGSVVDDDLRTWTQTSDDGSTAIFTAVA